jgi:hypothetical protein
MLPLMKPVIGVPLPQIGRDRSTDGLLRFEGGEKLLVSDFHDQAINYHGLTEIHAKTGVAAARVPIPGPPAADCKRSVRIIVK